MSFHHPFGFWDPVFLNYDVVHPFGCPADSKCPEKCFVPLLTADFIETPTDYHLHVDLPGVHKSDLNISMDNTHIKIEAHRKEIHSPDVDKVHKNERHFGDVSRVFLIPRNADIHHTSAALEHGVLVISIPKTVTESTEVRNVLVK